MTGINRGRYIVDLNGWWRIYTHPLQGWEMLGTVQRGSQTRALGLSPNGIYAQIEDGAIKMLNPRKIAEAYELARITNKKGFK